MAKITRREWMERVGVAGVGLALGSACRSDHGTTTTDAADTSEVGGDTTATATEATAETGATEATSATETGEAEAGEVTPPAPKYNVLLLVVDQERFPRATPSDLVLPAHARLLQRGTSFRRHYANAMPCTPSRSNLYTGLQVTKTGMFSNIGFGGQGSMATTFPTMGTLFKSLGYSTAYYGKWHLSEIDPGDSCSIDTSAALQPYGFDAYNHCGDYPGKVQSGYKDDPTAAADAAAWLASRAASADASPWLLTLNLVNPHDIMFFYNQPLLHGSFGFGAPLDPLYTKQWNVTLPPSYAEDLSTKPSAQRAYQKVYDTAQSYPDTDEGRLQMLAFINYYYNCQRDADRHLGTVLDALEGSRFAENTIIVFTSDHGEMGQFHGLRGKGAMVYEENNRVPLVIVHPDYPGGRTVDGLTAHVDLTPSLLALCGKPYDEVKAASPDLAGKDVTALLATPAAASPRTEALFTFDFGGAVDFTGMTGGERPDTNSGAMRPFLRGLFDGRYKFARYFASDNYHSPKSFEELVANNDLELYDLATDPDENTNLAADLVASRALIDDLFPRLEALIAAEIGTDGKPS